jgi:hypothetical protein
VNRVDPPDRRLARNEALFREVNESVRTLADGNGSESAYEDYFCECADVDCTIRVKLTNSEYEIARSEGNRFIVACGHERRGVERIVLETDRFVLVEKTGGGGDEAAKLDPRK